MPSLKFKKKKKVKSTICYKLKNTPLIKINKTNSQKCKGNCLTKKKKHRKKKMRQQQHNVNIIDIVEREGQICSLAVIMFSL